MSWNKENIFSAPARKLQMPKAGLLLQHNLPKGAQGLTLMNPVVIFKMLTANVQLE